MLGLQKKEGWNQSPTDVMGPGDMLKVVTSEDEDRMEQSQGRDGE